MPHSHLYQTDLQRRFMHTLRATLEDPDLRLNADGDPAYEYYIRRYAGYEEDEAVWDFVVMLGGRAADKIVLEGEEGLLFAEALTERYGKNGMRAAWPLP